MDNTPPLNKRRQVQRNYYTVQFHFFKVQKQNNCVKYRWLLARGRQRPEGKWVGGGGTSGVDTVSSLHTNEFCSESTFPKPQN